MKITDMKDAPFSYISTRNLSINTLLLNTSWASNLYNTKKLHLNNPQRRKNKTNNTSNKL